MSVRRLRNLYRSYQISEVGGIITALFMAVISFFPVIMIYDFYQLSVALFFLVIFIIRLALFIWNQIVKGTRNQKTEQALMMLVTAIAFLLTNAIFLMALFYQLIIKDRIPFLGRYMILTVVYGIYAFGKIAISFYNMFTKRKQSMYHETLCNISWISAVYSLALFTNYLLIAKGMFNYTWPKYLMIAVMGFVTLLLSFIMVVKSLSVLKKEGYQIRILR